MPGPLVGCTWVYLHFLLYRTSHFWLHFSGLDTSIWTTVLDIFNIHPLKINVRDEVSETYKNNKQHYFNLHFFRQQKRNPLDLLMLLSLLQHFTNEHLQLLNCSPIHSSPCWKSHTTVSSVPSSENPPQLGTAPHHVTPAAHPPTI